MVKSLRSVQQISSSSQDVHLLLESGTVRVLLAHLGPQNALSERWSFLKLKKKKITNCPNEPLLTLAGCLGR